MAQINRDLNAFFGANPLVFTLGLAEFITPTTLWGAFPAFVARLAVGTDGDKKRVFPDERLAKNVYHNGTLFYIWERTAASMQL